MSGQDNGTGASGPNPQPGCFSLRAQSRYHRPAATPPPRRRRIPSSVGGKGQSISRKQTQFGKHAARGKVTRTRTRGSRCVGARVGAADGASLLLQALARGTRCTRRSFSAASSSAATPSTTIWTAAVALESLTVTARD
jgi:hypothetical protein